MNSRSPLGAWLWISLAVAGLSGCSLFNKDEESEPAPLVEFSSTVDVRQAWSIKLGDEADIPYSGLRPTYDSGAVYAADHGGAVYSVDPASGRVRWKTETDIAIGAGPGVADDLVVVGSVDGEVIALDAATGAERWRAMVSSEVLAAPGVADGRVIVRALDGRVFGFDAGNGTRLWIYDSGVPLLTLRGNSEPLLRAGLAFIGFDSGKMVALQLDDGNVAWEQPVAVPQGRTELERIVDIDGPMEMVSSDLYAVTYQGLLASLTANSGRLLWVKDMSSFAGLTLARTQLNVADADDAVWGIERSSGGTLWKQDRLVRREICSPARHGDYVVVGDFEGYLHWLSEEDGSFAARRRAGKSAIVARPLSVGDTLFVQTSGGRLVAYRLSP